MGRFEGTVRSISVFSNQPAIINSPHAILATAMRPDQVVGMNRLLRGGGLESISAIAGTKMIPVPQGKQFPSSMDHGSFSGTAIRHFPLSR